MSDAIARQDAARPAAQLIAAVRDNAEHPWKPPGGGYQGALTHDVIHGLDISCALRIEQHIPDDVHAGGAGHGHRTEVPAVLRGGHRRLRAAGH